MEPKDFYLFSLEDKLAGPYRYGPHHTGIVGAILVCGDYTVMVRAIPVQQCNWYGPQHSVMAPTILVWWGPYGYGPANSSSWLKMYAKAGNLKKCAQNLKKGVQNLKCGVQNLKRGSKT